MESLGLIQKYDDYQKTHIHSVENIPCGWNILRFHDVFSFSKGLNITKENLQEDGIPCLNYGEIHSKFGFELRPEIHSLKCVDEKYLKNNKKSILRFGDFIFADTSEDYEGAGNFTYLNSEDEIFAGYHTLICRLKIGVNERYLAYVVDSEAFRLQVRRAVKGVKVFSITQGLLKGTKLWLASEEEQTRIANFLDKKTAQIDEAIAIKEQQISLLKERKQIIIQQAVTQGLDPNVPMKDSGVDWIGKIPEHWEMKRVKNIFRLVMQPSEKNNDYELLSVYTDIGVKPRRELEERGNKASTTDGYWFVKKGDIVVNKLLAWMGAIGLSEYEGVTSPAYDILRPKLQINGFFYHYLFRSDFCSAELKRHSRGIMDMRLRLYFDRFGVVEVPYPPVDEQNEIIHSLETEMKEMDKGIEHLNTQIEKLKEYKTTLINSAVTGKIKITPEMVER